MTSTATGRRPNQIIDDSPMSLGQWVVILVCGFVMLLDGYDVISISLAASSLASEWSLTKAQLGLILPLEFLGMALGAIFMGSFSDRFGRKRVLLLCLLIISIGMAFSSIANSMAFMGISRVFTGIGIGGSIAGGTAISSEFSNLKNRALAVILVAGGYTLGIFVAGKVGGQILTSYDWRMVFKLGAFLSFFSVPVIYWLIPDSLNQLARKDTEKSRSKISKILSRFGHDKNFTIEQTANSTTTVTTKELFTGSSSRKTVLLTIFYLGQIFTYYFFVKWMPPEVVDMGFSKQQSGDVLATTSLFGLIGTFAMAGFSRLISLKTLMIIALLGAGASVAAFPFFAGSIQSLHIVSAIAGFWLFAVISGAYGIFALSFHNRILASGTGLVIGLGRGGAIAGPWIAGILFTAGLTLHVVSPLMALGSILGAAAILFLPKQK